MYPISEQLLKFNRSYQKLIPQGWVIHSTATPGATAQREHDYFNSGNRQASAHYFVDSTSIIRCIPELEKAWHAGPTANAKFLSVEMCEVEPFSEVWSRTVWLVADACVRYGWATGPNVYSHRGISAMYKETDHTDPIAFLVKNGKTWEQLLSAIDDEIARIKTSKVIAPVTTQSVTSTTDKDGYLMVRVLDSKAAAVRLQIREMGYACEPLQLP